MNFCKLCSDQQLLCVSIALLPAEFPETCTGQVTCVQFTPSLLLFVLQPFSLVPLSKAAIQTWIVCL